METTNIHNSKIYNRIRCMFLIHHEQNIKDKNITNQYESHSYRQQQQPKLISQPASSNRETFGINQTNQEWSKIQQLINEEDYNEAYSQVLIKMNRGLEDMLLIKLMGKTGVCVEKLQKPVLEYLILKVIEMLEKKDFLNVLMLWISEITKILINDQYYLNLNSIQSLIEQLKKVADDKGDEFSNVTSQVKTIARQNYDSLTQIYKFY